MLLLEHNIIRKKSIDKITFYIKLDNNNDKSGKYKIKVISNYIIYIKKLKTAQPLDFYYLVL